MTTQEEASRSRVVALARMERGDRTRPEMWSEEAGVSFNTYASFESGKTWPRAVTLRAIEGMLGWRDGIIDDVISSGLEPGAVTLEHMRGEVPLVSPPRELGSYTDQELIAELARRNAERDRIHRANRDAFRDL